MRVAVSCSVCVVYVLMLAVVPCVASCWLFVVCRCWLFFAR